MGRVGFDSPESSLIAPAHSVWVVSAIQPKAEAGSLCVYESIQTTADSEPIEPTSGWQNGWMTENITTTTNK
jgi:hypothetical protein